MNFKKDIIYETTKSIKDSQKSKSGHILIISNNFDFMTSLCKILSKFEYLATGFTSQEDAVKLLKKKTFDVLITDIE